MKDKMEQETSWHSYPSIFALGHRALDLLNDGPVLVEEKVDGSQFSFGVFDGVLKIRSHGKEMFPDNEGNVAEKMFNLASQTARELKPLLKDGWTYRGEFLGKPKHNTLTYGRVPNKNIIIFDINNGHESYLPYAEKAEEAERLGLEVVPRMMEGIVKDWQELGPLLERESILGGTKIEGVVVKNYLHFGKDKKALMGKYVSDAFKELHGNTWKKDNPSKNDFLVMWGQRLHAEARWEKALQHATEDGIITGEPKDIGVLLKYAGQDMEKEVKEELERALWKWAWPTIQRIAVRGIPDWYKKKIGIVSLEPPKEEESIPDANEIP